MNRSTPPSKTSSLHHHQVAAAAAAASLPFSIDHILSSPIKQAAAVQAAVNQQQAAAMMMMNSQDMVSTAMLNEQLALLNQQQNHLLNPTALAAAAAAAAAAQQQHHNQQAQWQQQQQLMAAIQQQQSVLAAQAPLNPLTSEVAASAGGPNFLSCFMAYMLLQQQQQQQAQIPQTSSHHQLRQLAQNQPSVNSMLHPHHNHQLLGDLISPPVSSLKPTSGQKSVPIMRDSSPYMSNLSNQDHSRRDFGSRLSESPQSNHLNNGQPECSRRSRAQNHSTNSQASISKPNSMATSNSTTTTTTTTTTTNTSNNLVGAGESAALSSLSNFVTEMAPILSGSDTQNKEHKIFRSSSSSFNANATATANTNDYLYNKSNSPTGSNKSIGGNIKSNRHNIGVSSSNNNNGNNRKLNSPPENNNNISNGENQRRNDLGQINTLELISSAAQALKNTSASSTTTGSTINTTLAKAPPELVQKQPAWVFCTRYSDRPSSGPRTRRAKSKDKKAKDPSKALANDEKRPRTAFTSEQLEKLRQEFQANSYLDEKRRKDLAERLCLNENQIKIWFQNKRAKIKKQNNQPNPLRGLLVAGGLYNHSTATSDCSESYANGNDCDDDDDDDNGRVLANDDDNDNHNDLDNHQNHDQRAANFADNPLDVVNSNHFKSTKRSHQSMNDHDQDHGQLPGKRAKLLANSPNAIAVASGSESGDENSSRMVEDLDEDDERVISVS